MVKIGDKVRVFSSMRRTPDDGWEGEVVKVGRALATIRYDGRREDVFRLDTKHLNSKDWASRAWFKTLEDAALDERRKVAENTISRGHLQFTTRHHGYSLEQVEVLAAFVAAMGAGDVPGLPAGSHCASCDGHSCPDVG